MKTDDLAQAQKAVEERIGNKRMKNFLPSALKRLERS